MAAFLTLSGKTEEVLSCVICHSSKQLNSALSYTIVGVPPLSLADVHSSQPKTKFIAVNFRGAKSFATSLH